MIFMKKIYLLILGLITSVVLNAQGVTVTAPSPLTISDCSFPTAYSTLGDITIDETSGTDFSGTGDFVLTAPANFEFQAGTGSVTTSPGVDLTISNLAINANTITFTITVNSTTAIDNINN